MAGAAVLALAGAGVALGPARANEAPPRLLPPDPVRGGLVLSSVRGGETKLSIGDDSLDSLIRQADWSKGSSVSLDIMRELIASEGGPRLPDLDPSTSLGPVGGGGRASDGSGSVGRVGAVAYFYGPNWVDDIDGDGGSDLVVQTWDGTALAVSALSGRDGSEIWRSSWGDAEDLVFYPAGDVDDDGIDDFSLVRLQQSSEQAGDCPSSDGCEWSRRYDFVWDETLVSGRSGTSMWSVASAGWVESSSAWASSSGPVRSRVEDRDHSKGENVYPGLDAGEPGTSPDAVVANHVSFERDRSWSSKSLAGVTNKSEGETRVHSSTDVDILDKATGQVVRSMRSEGPHISWLGWAGQMVGDGSDDLLWSGYGEEPTSYRCRSVRVLFPVLTRCPDEPEPEQGFRRLAAVDGATLAQAWETRIDDGGWARRVADLTGDGVGDIAITYYDFGNLTSTLVSGSDGSVAWTSPGYLAHAGGEIGGVPGPDAVVINYLGDWDSDVRTVELARVEGATGASFLTTSQTVDTSGLNYTTLYTTVVSQITGSSTPDVTIAAGGAFVDSDTMAVSGERSHQRVEDGATGAVIAERDLAQMAGFGPLGDVTGDGADEGSSWHYEFSVVEDEWGPYLSTQVIQDSILDLVTFAELRPLPQDRWLIGAADLDGTAGDEVMFDRFVDGPSGPTYELSVVDGRTGAPRWAWSTAA